MRNGLLLALVSLTVTAGPIQAQNSVLPPVPQPVLAPSDAPQALPLPPRPAPAVLGSPEVLATPPRPVPSDPPPLLPPAPPPQPPWYSYPPPVASPPPVSSACSPWMWFGFEGLAWWTKSQPLSVPVLTTGPASQGSQAGNLGVPGTVPITSPLDYGSTSGVRFFLGAWFDTAQVYGIDGSLFFLSQQSAGFSVGDRSAVGNYVINEPLAGSTFSTQVSAPGASTGVAAVDSTSRFSGGELNALFNVYRNNGWTVHLLGGFRYLELQETLTISNSATLLSSTTYTDGNGNVLATAPPGSGASVIDFFGTRNQFYGGQVGARFERELGRWYMGGAAKLAVGATHEVINVNGSTLIVPVNGAPTSLQGGNFATGTNAGRYWDTKFAVAPELQLNAGYQITPCLRGMVGYNFLWLSSVARPGNQIDNTYDGVTHPAVPFASSSFWAQGLTFTLQFSY